MYIFKIILGHFKIIIRINKDVIKVIFGFMRFVDLWIYKSSVVLCFPQVAVKLITGQEQGSSCIELKLKEVRMKTQIKMTFAVLSIHSDLINATIMSVY